MQKKPVSIRSEKQPIPGFKIISKLGRGGMGAVYKAEQVSLRRKVAIKIMPQKISQDPEFRERFFREARAAGKLNHPNIVQGIDAGEAGKFCWIAMELVQGKAVSSLRREKKHLAEPEALSIITQIAQALEHAEAAGIVHRDVKPENFLIADDGTVKLCDLGISKNSDDASLTQDGRALGTPLYISPEQARGESDIDSRADIYSLGASWYHLLSGIPPFSGSSAAVIMTKHISEKVMPLRKIVPVSRATAKVISRMMEKEPELRYQNFTELLRDLRALADGENPSASSRSGKTFFSGKNRLVLGAAGIILLAIFALAMSPSGEPENNSVMPLPANTPGKTDQRSLEASREFEKISQNAQALSPDRQVVAYKKFAEKFSGTPEAEKALQEALRLEEQARARAEEQAQAALQKLPSEREQAALGRYRDFVERFKGTDAAERIRRRMEKLEGTGKLPEFRPRKKFSEPAREPGKNSDPGGQQTKVGAENIESAKAGALEKTGSSSADIRAAALEDLHKLSAGDAKEKALQMIFDRNENVRLQAVKILAGFVGEKKIREALEKVSRTDVSRAVRREAAKTAR